MVSAISLCLLALGLTAASSQLLPADPDSTDAPISERRTFKHGKPVKLLPFAKKTKKFAALVPHAFGKGHHYDVHEVSRPYYKVHRYHGIEVKPAHDVSFSTPEPFIESHSIEPPTGDFPHGFGPSDHSFPSSSFPDHSSFSESYVYDKPSFPSPPPAPIFHPLPPSQPKPVFSFLPAPQPVFQSIPVAPPAFPVSVGRPVGVPAPVFTSNPLPPQPVISVIPIKIQTPVLPGPSPAPIFQSVHPAPALPALPAPTPAPALSALPSPSPTPIIVKIPSPVLPAVHAPSPAPILPVVSATPAPIFPSIPVSLPPPQFSIPGPAPSLPTFPAFPSLPVSVGPEPEFPYPPSGSPIPSYIKDISLGDIDIKGSTIEPPTSTIDDGSKNLDHALEVIKHDPGFFERLKGWKADKANAALSHFTQFMQKPLIHAPNKVPLDVPVNPAVQFPGPVSPLPLGPASIFPIFPPTQFFSPAKYESFPPNNIETPPLLNSYGVPIPHDSYAPPHISHERLSSAASEEEPAVVPAPENKQQNSLRQDFQKFQPHDHPVYVPEENKPVSDGTNQTSPNLSQPHNSAKQSNKTIEDVQPETNADDVAAINYPNHKE